MTTDSQSLMAVYKGWDDYQVSLVKAIAPLSREQLAWRSAPNLRSVGEIAEHIVGGRVLWFHRILGEGSSEFAALVAASRPEDAVEENAAELVKWLDATWQMIEGALNRWTIADLAQTYPMPFQGGNYALTRQWIIWHVIAHDLHHGGELACILGMHGIALPDLGDEGGHLLERAPLAGPA